jgi:hypothetical protein
MVRSILHSAVALGLFISSTGCKRSGTAQTEEPEAPLVRASVAAVKQFHGGLSANQPSEICANADPHALDAVTQLPCPEFVPFLNRKLGPVLESKRIQTPLASAQPPHVALVYQTHFQRGEAREHFEYRVEGTRAILTTYRIKSDALNE